MFVTFAMFTASGVLTYVTCAVKHLKDQTLWNSISINFKTINFEPDTYHSCKSAFYMPLRERTELNSLFSVMFVTKYATLGLIWKVLKIIYWEIQVVFVTTSFIKNIKRFIRRNVRSCVKFVGLHLKLAQFSASTLQIYIKILALSHVIFATSVSTPIMR